MSRHWLTFWCVVLGIVFTGSLFAQAQKAERIPVVKDGLSGQVRQGDLKQDVGGPVPASTTATDILVNNNTGFTPTSQFIQSESDVIAFGNYVIVVFNDAGSYASGSHFTGWSRSTDGGATFTDGGLLPTSTVGDAGDPVIARNNTTGRLYFSTLGFNSPSNIQMFRSDDNGATWGAPVNCTPGGTSMDKQWHTVDNFPGTGNGYVYMIARDFGSGAGVFLWRSTDDGNTWGASGTSIVSGNQGAYVAVGSDHSVYAFWYATGAIMVRKSVDRGLTFGSPVTVASGLIGGTNGDLGLTGIRQGTTTASGFRSNEFPHVAVNPVSGYIYVTFNNKGAGSDKGDIFLVQSIDGGATWSAAVKINDDVTTTDQWQPTVAVTPAGNKMGIFYYSRQEDVAGNNLFKFYGRIGNISGATVSWPAASFAISDVASLPEFGRDAVVNTVYMGDYQHAYATPTAFHVAWSDNRDDLPGGAPRKDPNMYYEQILTTDNFGWAKGTITNVSGGAALSGVSVDFVQTPNAPSISDGAGFYKAGVQVDTPAVTRVVTLRATKFGFRDTTLTVTVTRNDTITRNFGMTPAAGGTLSVWSHTATTNLRSYVQVKLGTTVIISDSTNATTGLLTAPLPAGTYSVLVDAQSPYLTRNFPSVVITSGTTNVDALTQSVVTFNPTAMRDTLSVGGTHSKTLVMTNTSPDPVPFRISDDNASARIRIAPDANLPSVKRSMQQQKAVVLPKGIGNPNPGERNSPDGHGGPDAFGYSWIDSDDPGGPVFNWFDIGTIGTQITTWTGTSDDGYATVPLPFSFSFYGTTYPTTLNVCTNGFMSFTSTSTAYSNSAIPSSGEPNSAIYPFWDDLNLTSGGTVKYYYDTPNTRFIVQYTNVPFYSGTGTSTFQVILNANGQIFIQYLSMTGTNSSATVGIENAAGTVALQVVSDAAYIHDNLAVRFYLPDAPWISENPLVGTIPASSTQNVICSFDASGLTPGTTYNANLFVEATHPDLTGRFTVPASLRVNAAAGAVINVSPTTLTFPSTIIGTTRRDSSRVRNVGTANLVISSVTSNNARYVPTLTSSTIVPGDSARLRVAYTPVIPAGSDTGRVIILSNDPGNPRVDIILNGTSVGSYIFRTSIDSLTKNMSGAMLDSTRFYIRNAGTAAGNYSARAVMIPRTLDGQEGKPIVIPMMLKEEPVAPPRALPSGPAWGSAPNSDAPMTKASLEEINHTFLLVGIRGIALNLSAANAIVKFDLDVPGTLNVGPTTVQTFAGGYDATQSYLLAIQVSPQQLIRIDTATGVTTVIGPTSAGADNWVAAKVDPVSGTLYGASTNGTTSTLWTVNTSTGAPTVVGDVTGVPVLIAMAFDNSGQLYGYDIDNAGVAQSRFFSINKTTGAATLIGNMGFVGRFAQDMEFDRTTNIGYCAAYNYTNSMAELRTANVTTGNSTLIGPLGAGTGVELDCFGIKGTSGPSTNWLSVAPTSGGPVAVNDSTRLTAYFDTRSPGVYGLPGNYFGRVEITNPGAPAPDTLKIPVRMFLQPAAGADLVVAPDSVDVGNVEIGRTDSSKTVLVRNIGASTLTVTNVTFSGTGAASFASSRTTFSLTSLDTLRIKVKFTAAAPGGVRTARMNFTCNDPTPQSVGLRGTSLGVAHFVVVPDTFAFTRNPTVDTTRATFKIRNTGTDTLRYQINETSTSPFADAAAIRRSTTQQPSPDLPKGSFDPTPGQTDSSGGPDAYGYRWIDSDSPGGPAFSWVEISTVGTPVTTWTGSTDDGSFATNFTWPFSFYGTAYLNFFFTTNGWVGFNAPSTEYTNTAIPTTAAPNNAIYAWWDDLDAVGTSGDRTVYYYNDVANSRYIVEWNNVRHLSAATDTLKFQAILKSNGEILLQYLRMVSPTNLTNATIGIENADGTVGLQTIFNASYVHNNLAIRITSDLLPWMSTDRTSGTIAPSDSQSVQLRIHPFGTPVGLYYGVQRITGNTPDVGRVRVGLRVLVGVGETASLIPAEFALSQNYPNPFNPTTKIKYNLPEQATVVLKIYNVLGQEVMTLADAPQAAGYYEATWDGRNTFGTNVSSGVYFYRFEATGNSGQRYANLKKMLFLK